MIRIGLAIFLMFPVISFAQTEIGAWTGLQADVPLTKKWKTGIEFQARFDQDLTRLNTVFISTYLNYELSNFIKTEYSYRFTMDPGKTEFRQRHTLDFIFGNWIDFLSEDSRFSFDTRLRGTFEYFPQDQNETELRLKGVLKYNLKGTKIEPYLSSELFYHFQDQIIYTANEVTTRGAINKWRLRAGLSIPLNKRHELKTFYLFQDRIGSDKIDHIFGLKYAYSFRRLNKAD